MKKFISWFKKLKQNQQVAIFSSIGGSIIIGFFTIIAALINTGGLPHIDRKTGNQQENETTKQPKYTQHPEVNRINTDIFEYFKQIDKKTDKSERQRLLDIVFGYLEKSLETDQNDGETYFLLAEAHLRNNDYLNALHYYDFALQKQYFYECDVHYGYGFIYEVFGDQHISNNDLSSANVYYKHSIDYLVKAIGDQYLYSHNIEEIKNLLSRVEFKKENYNNADEFFTSFSALYRDNNNISLMNELAIKYVNLKMWKNALKCYYWLFERNTTGQRRLGILRDFQYISGLWEFSDDFLNDISINSVEAIINSENVNFRYEPTVDDNVIKEFELYEEVQILQRSEFRQNIGNVRTYWYKIRTSDGIEGWVYGQYLWFYPNPTFQ